MKEHNVIIVGGGISGLSLAYYCAEAGMKTALLEKNSEVGGSFASPKYSSSGRNFWLELGAHTCYSSYQNLLDIIEGCGASGTIIPRAKVPFSLMIDGQIKSIVSQLSIPELLMSAPNLFKLKKTGQSVKSYYSKIVGEHNYRDVVSHFFNAVPSQPTDDFPADMMFKSREKRKDMLKNYTFSDGLQGVAFAIAARRGISVFPGMDVQNIRFENGKYLIKTAGGDEFIASILALAMPSASASALLRDLNPDIANHLGQLKAATVDSVGVIVRKEHVSLKPVAAIISPGDVFFSAVSRDTVPDETFRGFAFHFRPGLDEKIKRERITSVLGVSFSKIEHTVSRINTVPSLRMNHAQWLDKTNTMLKDKKNLLLTGNYFGGMAIEDCVIRSKSECERLKG
ncbi:MAG: FAD-dependent oxidoreductase [Chlorobium sp.]|uniref:protoporphyrinogen/coproporphyrinogen oxidase n=1 Tax=Chlorobium sp. TaxID=1095 RepID=UPI001DC15B28|nr:FAD-dependent oxidoreductase [Chlorobium sp.]MBN1279338.1 FAD-dependent oxidoreductase [Chlorobiaceae bacterium]MCF8215395.1 FAD-dependent oxidoreductase [Chlorobium sp.]MCF8270233.1 FAD-dependent oxidoreductase [Chlorobium sp.]MCF8286602.1 FAD-dependent oxidoreductase [Chlorobium sp.]MCF8290201.1 FAD-dependent oxidoreductase [Chlorobium sp.]